MSTVESDVHTHTHNTVHWLFENTVVDLQAHNGSKNMFRIHLLCLNLYCRLCLYQKLGIYRCLYINNIYIHTHFFILKDVKENRVKLFFEIFKCIIFRNAVRRSVPTYRTHRWLIFFLLLNFIFPSITTGPTHRNMVQLRYKMISLSFFS